MEKSGPAASLVLPTLLRPILSQLENRDVAASQTLRAALSKTEVKKVLSTHCSWAKSYPTLIHGLKQTSKYEITS